MIQPDALRKSEPLTWSAGSGSDYWELICACVDGRLERVERLLLKDPALARSHFNYRKPIYFAVRENRIEIAALLFERDPDPIGLAVNDSLLQIAQDRGHAEMERMLRGKLTERRADGRGEPMAAAIRANDLRQVKRLLDGEPGLLEAGDARGNLPIHWGAMTRRIGIINELHRRGADLNAKRVDGARPIQLTRGDYHFRNWGPSLGPSPAKVIAHLRGLGAECDICTACHLGDLKQVKKLLDQEPSLVNRASDYLAGYACAGTALRNAAAAGHFELTKFLLARGADPNLPEEGIAPRGHAVYSAAANGHFEVVQLLLEHGGHPNVEVESSADTLSRVFSNKDKRMTELLLTHGAARGVHLLAYYNDLKTAAAVFAVNPELANDAEALANAAGEGHESFVRLMLRYQPDLPLRVRFPGWSVGGKTKAINELLFQHGMDPSAPDWLGITPLHQFARTGDVEKAKIFLSHGADIHARDEDIQSTPLGWAAKFGQKKMAALLLKHGARASHPDDPPWAKPTAWAERRGHPEIVRMLERFDRSS